MPPHGAPQTEEPSHSKPLDFVRQLVTEEIAAGRWGPPGDASVVRTRFPPEPNGFLHIGHAKSICLNFGLGEEFGGACNLRFDDTNPAKEEQRFVDSIIRDVRWLGYRWPGSTDADPSAGVRFASDYFERMYAWAIALIRGGHAFVCDLNAEEMRAHRGSLTEPGRESPHRARSVQENLDLFERMRTGEFPDGAKTLRAKIDMASPNIVMRDPVMYRIVNKHHHRTGNAWHIYPSYDWAHGLEDSIEGITHSLCTLEFEINRPLYDWFIDRINECVPSDERIHHPQQTEFARLNPTFVITSKRKLKQLVDERHVDGWDDPRMPTISGMRRRGYTPEAIRAFCKGVGVTRFNATHDYALLENAVREDLNARAPRRMVVMDPIRIVITNWGEHGDEGRTEWMDAVNNPEDASAGLRKVPFSRTLLIERDDFMEDPPKKFFRLAPGAEVRLRYAYWITCHEVIKDQHGAITELRCTYDPQTRGGDAPPPAPDGTTRKVKGTLHWVSADHAVPITVREYDRLFAAERPDKEPKDAPPDWSFLQNVNPDSLRIIDTAHAEPALLDESTRDTEPRWPEAIRRYQFERLGYYALDEESTQAAPRPVFNRTVALKDSWTKAK
ncbi:MAG: glutamine--tRNA ligase/YqeY domain fusion protein [Phycisphaerales bacterium]